MRAYAAWAVLAAGAAYETQTDLSCASSNAPCPTLWGLTRGLESSVAPFLELEAGANLSLSLSVVTAGTSSPSTTAVALRSDCLDFALVHVGCVVDDGACEERSVATVSTTAEELATCDGAAHDGTGALTLPLVVDVDVGYVDPAFVAVASFSHTVLYRVDVSTSASWSGGAEQLWPPSPAPTPAPSPRPSPRPTPAPSHAPTPAPSPRPNAFALEARVASGPNRHVSASATVAFVANRAPTSGGVDVDPVDGEAARTIFGLTAASWVDDDYPLAYTFFSEVAGAENSLIYDALEPSFDAILPVGDAGNGHALVVGVSVKDALEAVARATTQAHVRPATFSKRAESKRESDGDAARWIRDDDTAALDVADDDGGSDDELLDPPDIPRSPPGSQGPAAFWPDDDDDVSVVLEK